jgi:hypothetical protein
MEESGVLSSFLETCKPWRILKRRGRWSELGFFRVSQKLLRVSIGRF